MIVLPRHRFASPHARELSHEAVHSFRIERVRGRNRQRKVGAPSEREHSAREEVAECAFRSGPKLADSGRLIAPLIAEHESHASGTLQALALKHFRDGDLKRAVELAALKN